MHKAYPAVLSKAEEIFVDATHNTSKTNSHLYSIVGCEQGYGVSLGFMLLNMNNKEDAVGPRARGEVTDCIRNFFAKAKELELNPQFVHTNKDYAEINAAQASPRIAIYL